MAMSHMHSGTFDPFYSGGRGGGALEDHLMRECDHRNRHMNTNDWYVDWNSLSIKSRRTEMEQERMRAVQLHMGMAQMNPTAAGPYGAAGATTTEPVKKKRDIKNLVAYYYNRK